MVKINKIYTRSGDQGETHLVGGERIAKDSLRVAAYGEVDELNCFVGQARSYTELASLQGLGEVLALIQNELFDLGSELASRESHSSVPAITKAQIDNIEKLIDSATEKLPELKSFVLPGGHQINSSLHICRSVCRRAERTVLALSRKESVSSNAIIYLNRLSDLFFALARQASQQLQQPEYLWLPGQTSKGVSDKKISDEK